MFYDVERPFDCIFYILCNQKSDLDVFAEVIKLANCPVDFIIFLFDVLKNDCGEVNEAMLQRPYKLIFCILSIE
jgi:hypothetical protein